MKNIEIELYRRGKTVFGWCNYLAEDLKDEVLLVKVENGFALGSCVNAILGNDYLDIAGTEEDYYNEGFMETYDSEEKAIEICNSIKECVNKLNAQEPEEKIEIERVI